jgi:hypothetical protein
MNCCGVCGLDGILGGVDGGLIADWLSVVGGRYWLTAGEAVCKKKNHITFSGWEARAMLG